MVSRQFFLRVGRLAELGWDVAWLLAEDVDGHDTAEGVGDEVYTAVFREAGVV